MPTVMFWLTLVSGVVALIWVAMLINQVFLPRIIVILGNVDSWWSPFRTLPPPGEMYIIVRGDPNGPFDSIIESVEGYRYDEAARRFTPDPNAITKNRTDSYGQIGVQNVGFNKYILWRKISYDKWEKEGDNSTKWKLVPKVRGVRGREDSTPSIFFRYNIGISVEDAEAIGNFPVSATVVVTVEMIDPVQALFFAGGWESQLNAAVQGEMREYIGTRDVNQLRQEKAAGSGTMISKIKNLDLLTLYGIEVTDARFVDFDLASGDQAMTDAVRGVEIAELKKQARQKDGEGKQLEREAESKGIKATVEAWASNEVGPAVAMAEAIKEAKPQVLGGNVVAAVDTKPKTP